MDSGTKTARISSDHATAIDRYPALAAAVADGVFDPAPAYDMAATDLEVEFGIERMLDGIESHVRTRRAARE